MPQGEHLALFGGDVDLAGGLIAGAVGGLEQRGCRVVPFRRVTVGREDLAAGAEDRSTAKVG